MIRQTAAPGTFDDLLRYERPAPLRFICGHRRSDRQLAPWPKRFFPTLGSTDFAIPHLHLAKLVICFAFFDAL